MQTFHAAIGNYNMQFDCEDCSTVKSAMDAKNIKLVAGPVKGVENFAMTNHIQDNMKITTFGQETNLNSLNGCNR